MYDNDTWQPGQSFEYQQTSSVTASVKRRAGIQHHVQLQATDSDKLMLLQQLPSGMGGPAAICMRHLASELAVPQHRAEINAAGPGP